MRRSTEIFQKSVATILMASLLASSLSAVAQADTASDPSLVISQLKITSSSGQFITLYNPTGGMLNMSNYQLEYFNSYDLTKATSSKLIALSGTVPPHGYFMVNDGALLLCYQLTVDSVSLGLSSTAGLVELLAFNQATPGSSVTPTLEDYVGWSKTAANGAQTLPTNTTAFLQRQPVDAQKNPAISIPGTGSWQAVQPDATNSCSLVSGNSLTTPVSTGLNQLLPSVEPAATIISLTSTVTAATNPVLPASDIGLMAPEVTEILPNPAGTGNDGTDEFIELYNPNATSFDLTGFSLQAGTTALHTFTFPGGANLPASSFTAFYSATTSLSLSNSGGQVKLLDPFGNSISATGVYGTAKDGQAWALANGTWYWTTTLTPGVANIIKQPVAVAKSSKNSSAKSKTAKSSSVKSASTNKAGSSSTTDQAATAAAVAPIHAWALAVVAGLALLYGVYEYRHDFKNRIYQLRKYLRTRRADRA